MANARLGSSSATASVENRRRVGDRGRNGWGKLSREAKEGNTKATGRKEAEVGRGTNDRPPVVSLLSLLCQVVICRRQAVEARNSPDSRVDISLLESRKHDANQSMCLADTPASSAPWCLCNQRLLWH